MNPRWLLWAEAEGLDPASAPAWRFIVWINERWREWEKATGHSSIHKSTADHAAFDEWLGDWVRPQTVLALATPTT